MSFILRRNNNFNEPLTVTLDSIEYHLLLIYTENQNITKHLQVNIEHWAAKSRVILDSTLK